MTHYLQHVENSNNLSTLFNTIDEVDLWPLIWIVVTEDDTEGNYYPLIILRGLTSHYRKLQDKASAEKIITFILEKSKDEIIFSAVEETILNNANEFGDLVAKKIHRLLETRYISGLSSDSEFIVIKAMEGTVMFPLLRGNDALLLRSIGLLISEFPEIPIDPSDPAYLTVKAIKLLGHCFDKKPDNEDIRLKIESLLECENFAVKSEANFSVGIINLYAGFRATEENQFLEYLQTANEFFIKSYANENRTDAHFFSAIISFFLSLLTGVLTDLTHFVSLAKGYLLERLLLIGRSNPVYSLAREESLSGLIFTLENWNKTISQAAYWPNITPGLHKLAELYASARELEVLDGLSNTAANTSVKLVMLPTVMSQLIKVQNISSKLTEILSDQEWRNLASQPEIDFYEMLLRELPKISHPKELAAVDLIQIRTAASKAKPWIADLINKLLMEGKRTEEILISILDSTYEDEIIEKLGSSANQAVNEISEFLINSLSSLLNWDLTIERNRIRWSGLKNSIIVSANFFHQLYIADSSSETAFLFAKPDGKGEDAVEKDLEDYFYKAAKWFERVKVEKQPKDLTPGRPDLAFRTLGDYIFPVEVKKEEKDISKENIRLSYMAQAQTYASSQNQLSFLFVLDVTKKHIGTPLSNHLNFCYVDRNPVSGDVLDYVAVFIFPANRLSPSAHSWQRKKET